MSSSVEKIKERLSIVDVISSYISITEAGKNYKAKCPFHNEKTPSFFISPERNTYYCFGCGAKGDIFSFVENFEGVDFLGSLKLLASKAGITLENTFSKEPKNNKEKLYQIMEEATIFFEKKLGDESLARAYLINRGVTDETIKSFRIGFAPQSWKSVSTYLIEKGFKKEDLESVGLIKIKENNISSNSDNFYDRFRSRIIFPINDSSGRVIAFSGRIFENYKDKKSNTNDQIEQAKYLNSPETPLFSKSNTLFGIDKAKTSIRKSGYSIIVEGQMDLIMSHQAGFNNTVAVSGTALSDRINEKDNYSKSDKEDKVNNFGLIRRLSPNVIFAFDGDQAGIRASNRGALIALSLDMQVKIAIIPEGKDPADLIKDDPKNWKEIIKNSKNIITFHLGRICESTNDLRMRGKHIRDIIFPFLLLVKSSIEKSAYISLLSKETSISESDIISDFEKFENLNKTNEINNDNSKDKLGLSRRDILEEGLMGIIFWQKGKKNGIINTQDIENSLIEKIGKDIFDKIIQKHKLNYETLAFESEILHDGKNKDDIKRDYKEMILNLEEEILNEERIYLLSEINKKDTKTDPPKSNKLLEDYQKIVKRIENIKSNRYQ